MTALPARGPGEQLTETRSVPDLSDTLNSADPLALLSVQCTVYSVQCAISIAHCLFKHCAVQIGGSMECSTGMSLFCSNVLPD